MANRLIQPGRIEAVAGVNLPMLVRVLTYCHQPLDVVVSKAITGGMEGVLYMLAPWTEYLRTSRQEAQEMPVQEVEIVNKLGLHARTSSKFTQLASQYQCEVWVSRKSAPGECQVDHGGYDAGGRQGQQDHHRNLRWGRRKRGHGCAGCFGGRQVRRRRIVVSIQSSHAVGKSGRENSGAPGFGCRRKRKRHELFDFAGYRDRWRHRHWPCSRHLTYRYRGRPFPDYAR